MANIITLARFPLLFAVILMFYSESATVRLVGIGVFVVAFLMDTLDGIVARKRGESSLLGSVLDIALDRIFEFVMWILYADLDLIPIAIPLIVISRGVLVDAIRSVGAQHGDMPFSQMQRRWSQFIVGSRTMRSLYGAAKLIAFGLLALAWVFYALTPESSAFQMADLLHTIGLVVSWIAVIICVVRAIPVLAEGPSLLAESQALSPAEQDDISE